MKKLSLSRPMTPSEIEELYYKIIRTQQFYNEDYATEWKKDDTPHKIIAKMVSNYFEPTKVIDIGCGLGKVVKYLREAGAEAYGMDYSEAFINGAPSDLRKYLSTGDITKLNFNNNSFDMIICMEVFEHLPLGLIDTAIEELKRICSGSIFVTIPSYGPNDYGPYGLPLNEKGWFDDAKKNIPFTQIVVDDKGVPDCGHITLGTYRWWSEKFFQHNLVRDGQLELKINNDKELYISRWNWNIYILNEITENNLYADSKQFGAGWHQTEDWGQTHGKIRWAERESEVFLMPIGNEKKCKIDFFSGPRELIYDRTGEVIIEQKSDIENYVLGRIRYSANVDECGTIEVPLSRLIPQRYLRVKIICDRKFIPEKAFNSPDIRELGIAVKRIYLE